MTQIQATVYAAVQRSLIDYEKTNPGHKLKPRKQINYYRKKQYNRTQVQHKSNNNAKYIETNY